MAKQQASIDILKYPENVRMRRGMYLNSPDHCVFEIIDNAVDEYSAGHASKIVVTIINDLVTVIDDGAGIPVTPHKDPQFKGLSQVEIAMTTLHAGGKMSSQDGYKSSTSGLNGVGASCVNAVSSQFNVIVRCNNTEYEVDFKEGKTTKHLYKTGNPVSNGKTGTEIRFILDPTVWGDEWYDFNHITQRLKQLAYLNPGLEIVLKIESHDKNGNNVNVDTVFLSNEGLIHYINDLVANKSKISEPVTTNNEHEYTAQIHPSKTENGVIVTDYSTLVDESRKMLINLAFVYTDSYSSDIKSFVNNVRTEYGGDHETGFKMGIFSAMKKYMIEHKLIKKENEIESDDCQEGLVAIVSVKLKDPNFEGQGKNKIHMPMVRSAVKKATESFLEQYLAEDENRANCIIEKILKAIKAREAARKARNVARAEKQITMGAGPKDFADCTSNIPEECEIFLVEGDSAGGSAKQARDRKFQAILPVFGKILNIEKSTFETAVKSIKLQDMIKALGCGIGNTFDIEKLRFHRIILMSDADVDGGHIQCLHMANMFRTMKPIIERGYLYAACPPLYRATKKKGKTNETHYFYNDEELSKFDTKGYVISRFKGLGEMPPEELWETTMNPKTRHLIRITLEDVEDAEETLNVCMGKNTDIRKRFLLEYL